jgi:hypothetical protein
MSDLLASVSADRNSVNAGESVRIRAVLDDQHPNASITIDGLAGHEHVLQAPARPGAWRVAVIATDAGIVEQRDVEIMVDDGLPPLPRLGMLQDPYVQSGAVFALFDRCGTSFIGDGTHYIWTVGSFRSRTETPVCAVDLAAQVDDSRLFTIVPVEVIVTPPNGSAAVVERTLTLWSEYQIIRSTGVIRPRVHTSGRAHRAPTTAGAFAGSYTISNREEDELRIERMQIEWITPDGVDLPGAIQPLSFVVAPGTSVTRTIELDRRSAQTADGAVVYLHGSCAGLPAHTSIAFDLVTSGQPIRVADNDDVTRDRSLGALLRAAGSDIASTPPGVDQHVDGHFLWLLDQVADVETTARPRLDQEDVGISPRSLSMVRRGSAMRFGDIAALRRQLIDGDAPSFQIAPVYLVPAVAIVAEPVEGSPCDPDALPDPMPDNWACQFTNSWHEQLVRGRIMNARKGDIILSPGGTFIGDLLAQVQPPQLHSHTLVCTKNRVEVAHSTASLKWLKTKPNGGVWEPFFDVASAPSNGFQPSALKYLWPGGVIQCVEDAVNGSLFQSPEGDAYKITGFSLSGFAEFDDNFEVIPALVVKPPPEEETAAVRADLHRLADAARAMCVTGDDTRAGRQSSVHYRAFGYTEADIAITIDPTGLPEGRAPADAGWAAGTDATVCSSFIWLAARRVGLQLEGPRPLTQPTDLEASDVEGGAMVDDQTADGLYYYTADERARAADWLYSHVYQDVLTDLENRADPFAPIWNAFSDMADDVANQVCNAFAYDDTSEDATDSINWKALPRVGHAVSPDDILFWDPPSRGGRYGYLEPLVYRPARMELVPDNAWHLTLGNGTLRGTVRFRGQPVVNALVTVTGTELFTDAAGQFTLDLLEGPYVINVGAYRERIGYLEAQESVTVILDTTVELTIELQEPLDTYRQLIIQGLGNVNDFEPGVDDENEDVSFVRDIFVSAFSPTAEPWTWSEGVGGEIRVELRFTATYQEDHSVLVALRGRFYEGTSEGTHDREQTRRWSWTIPADDYRLELVRLWNQAEGDPEDHATIVVLLRNERAP